MMNSIKTWYSANQKFTQFLVRFLVSYLILTLCYRVYLRYTSSIDQLDQITYLVSRGSFEIAKLLGVADCEWSCFYGGCYIGSEIGRVNVISGCNGLALIILYTAYVVGMNKQAISIILNSLIGLFTITSINMVRIGLLILYLQSNPIESFKYLKLTFTLFLYLSIIILWLVQPRINQLINRIVK